MSKRDAGLMSTCFSALLLTAGLAAPAHADTFSMTAGPIPLSPVPLNVCSGNVCVKTPKMGNATLTVEVTPDDLMGLLPDITRSACPPGQIGVALQVQANFRDTSVSGSLTGNVGALPFKHPISEVKVPAGRTFVVSACTF